ncbi:hypothetical protein GYMLUDRAFT_235955 [Collybiopsis luxurians FD-317 M1]|nr:hypothetical protein GYMLUDRAFT_235955 [Collybiopsis luxurians FD-317 M1]
MALPTTATPYTLLPARREGRAPHWVTNDEIHLPTFFLEFETVAQAAGIDNDHNLMKRSCLRYIDADSFRFWRTLDSFEDDEKTWNEFKEEVISHYPDARDLPWYMVDDPEKAVAEFAQSDITNIDQLARYHRAYAVVAHSLEKKANSISLRGHLVLHICFTKKNAAKDSSVRYSMATGTRKDARWKT